MPALSFSHSVNEGDKNNHGHSWRIPCLNVGVFTRNVSMVWQERSVVWLYPDTSGDHDGDDHAAFLVADGECKRIEAQVNDKKSEAILMQLAAVVFDCLLHVFIESRTVQDAKMWRFSICITPYLC